MRPCPFPDLDRTCSPKRRKGFHIFRINLSGIGEHCVLCGYRRRRAAS